LSWAAALAVAATLLLPAVQPQALALGAHGSYQPNCPPPCPQPRPSGYHRLVFDRRSGQVYLFGQFSEFTIADAQIFDVWAFSLATQRWRRLWHSDTYFSPFNYDSLALDEQSGKVIFYQPFAPGPAWDYTGVETWAYNIQTNTFEKMQSVDQPDQPPMRWGSRMAYDPGVDRVILFGGSDLMTGDPLNDTWAYDYESNSWVMLAPTLSPPTHNFHDMVYHPLAHRIVMFGGPRFPPFGRPGEEYFLVGDTWAFDSENNTWIDLQPSNPPPARYYHSMGYDPWSNQIIMFGGVPVGPLADETWPHEATLNETWAYSYSHNAWQQLTPAVSPSPRAWQGMIGTWLGPLMFGGGPDRMAYTNESWLYRAFDSRWKQVLPCHNPGGSGIPGSPRHLFPGAKP
jgi:hypothetical protein